MTNKDCVRRLQREYQKILKDPTPGIRAVPNPENILEWHYIVEGPEGTPFQGGVYHGKIKFPEQYPHKPPSIMMITPNGRFKPETRLCLSYSDFHPETWNPMWNVTTIITGLVSFMTSTEDGYGTMESSDSMRRFYAQTSMEYNRNNPVFRKHFEDLLKNEASSSTTSSTTAAPITATSSTSSASSSSSANGPVSGAKNTNNKQDTNNSNATPNSNNGNVAEKPDTKNPPHVQQANALQNNNTPANQNKKKSSSDMKRGLIFLVVIIAIFFAVEINRYV